MKVIMLKDVKGVGQRGRVVDVADGYALNSLIPRKVAEQATDKKLREYAAHEKIEQDKRNAEDAALKETVQRLNNAEIVISARATEKGGLFKSVTATDVQNAIAEQKGARLELAAVLLATPIKTVGEHPIIVKAAETAAQIKLVIKRI